MASRKTFDQLIQPFQAKARDRSSPWGIVLWWELRRIPYNLIVGGAGLFSGVIAFTAAGISESKGGEPVGVPDGIFILVAPILFGIGANICYTAGWMVELLTRSFLRQDVSRFATPVFRAGVAFSVAVTFLPALFAVVYLLGR